MINDQRVEKALKYLIETDEAHGILRGQIKGLEHRLKICLDRGALTADAKSMSEKTAMARAGEEYGKLVEEYENACIDFYTIDSKRFSEQQVIEVYRTQSSNRRSGNI